MPMKKKIILELNEKDNIGWYPLLKATDKNNIEMVQLLIDYATENKIILELNEKDDYGYYPLLDATYFDDIEMIKLLIDYANKNKIILKLNEKVIVDLPQYLRQYNIIILKCLNC